MNLRFLLSVSLILLPAFAQAQSTERLYAAVSKPAFSAENQKTRSAGLYVTSLENHDWKNVAWPDFSVRTSAVVQTSGLRRLVIGGEGGILLPFGNPTGWQLLTDWRFPEVLDLEVDPFTEQNLYAATAAGFYYSTDKGAHWTDSNSGLISLFVGCLLADPKQQGRILAGTESGLFESNDAGKSWNALALPNVAVRALLREPVSWPGIFWVGTEDDGLHESFDGGKIFQQVTLEDDSVSVYTLAGGGANAPIYAGVYGRGLYSASSPGDNWAHVAGSEGLGTVLTILVMPDLQTIYAGTHRKGVFRSKDRGATWESFGLMGSSVRALIVGEADWTKP